MKYSEKLSEVAALALSRCTDLVSSQVGFELRVQHQPDYLRITAFFPDPQDKTRMLASSMYVTLQPRPVPKTHCRKWSLRMDVTASICGGYSESRELLAAFAALHDLMRSIDIKIRDQQFEL